MIAVLLDEKDVTLVFVRTTYHVSMVIAEFIELSLENLGFGSAGMNLQIQVQVGIYNKMNEDIKFT